MSIKFFKSQFKNIFFTISLITLIVFYILALVREPTVEVYPGTSIQDGLERAKKLGIKKVLVKEGEYYPTEEGQALIWLNKSHHGISLIADGKVTLYGHGIKNKKSMVNHIIYIGDGIDKKTLIKGFTLSGINNIDFVTKKNENIVEPNIKLGRKFIYYSGGGAIKIFGNSSPVLDKLTIENNEVLLCGAGISIEHMGEASESVIIKNTIFRNNRNGLTGSAIDILPGSKVIVENSLFINNKSNEPRRGYSSEIKTLFPSRASKNGRYSWDEIFATNIYFKNSSAVTVARGSNVKISNSVFINNRNAFSELSDVKWYSVRSKKSQKIMSLEYIKPELKNNIFMNNNLDGGVGSHIKYGLKASDTSEIRNNLIIEKSISETTKLQKHNLLLNDLIKLDSSFLPIKKEFSKYGLRFQLLNFD